MTLKKYLSKRNLKKSLEPVAKLFKRKKGPLQFVIQKHAASHLHYDFRIEVNGVLKSFAIPKGPSLDPKIKRLAIMVEDHPYQYRKFEGIIPSGYGKGTVMIWDQGSYSVYEHSAEESEAEIISGLKKGSLHFTLHGEKVQGAFSLVKIKNSENEWLLIKKNDEYATKKEITEKNRSVISHKTLEEIAGQSITKPLHIAPMLCTLIDEPFNDPDWIFELKWDGFRALAELQGNNIELYSRNFQDFRNRFPGIVNHLKALNLDAVLDGEIVALDKKGVSKFQLLQNNSSEENIYFCVFDILYLNGQDLRSLPLIERKKILKSLIKSHSHIRYFDFVDHLGVPFFNSCKQLGYEGVIGKKKNSTYISGKRSKEWVKIKADLHQELVICGFTEARTEEKKLGALIAGVYKEGILHFAGHVGTGFTEKKRHEVRELLLPLKIKKCPFESTPKTNAKVTWVKPKYLCEVKFKEWTNEGIMRQSTFLGIRSDKPVKSVIKEKPISKKLLIHNKYDFITHPDKLFWEQEKITKGQLLSFYEEAAPLILPYLKDRPESLRRFPDGISKPSFFQKNLTKHPDWISTVAIEHSEKMVNYLVIDDVESLLYAVNLGCIEIHPWLSRHQHIDHPDFLLFDLDPVDISFNAVIQTAQVLHDLLEEIGVPSYCKTSGSRGLHICVPLNAKYTYEQSKQFALIIANLVNQKLPKITSLERLPKNRSKKVYIDCFQNNFGQTIAAPYSVRAKPGAPVSTPLEWNEVVKGLNPLDFTIFTMKDRLKKTNNYFKPVLQKGMDMSKALKKINSI